MKLLRLILSIMMLLGFSSYAGATIINLGNGAFYYTGLTITQPQNLVNNYLSLLGSEVGPLPDADLSDAVYKVSIPNNLNTEDPGGTGSYVPGQSGSEQENPAPVPEPATMLLLGTGLVMTVGYMKKLRRLA
jgi:hypothetical protein